MGSECHIFKPLWLRLCRVGTKGYKTGGAYRELGKDHEVSVTTIDGVKYILKGILEENTDSSLAELVANQAPSFQMVELLTKIINSLPPTKATIVAPCKLIREQPPTKLLQGAMYELIKDANPCARSLNEGSVSSKSSLKVLTDLAAQQQPTKQAIASLTSLIAGFEPTATLLRSMAEIVKVSEASR